MGKHYVPLKTLFEGIYTDDNEIYTKNLARGQRVYGEKLFIEGTEEYRAWNPNRSKYAAALKNGLQENIFFAGQKVLYLGSAEGTTMSHVSDLVGEKGMVLGVDVSEIAMMKLIDLAETRKNIFPILADAEQTDQYKEYMGGEVDTMFQDIAQRNQAEIFVKNAKFLKKKGLAAIAIKTKSISQSKKKEDILAEEKKELKKAFDILQVVSLEPYEKGHYLLLLRKK
jgi:fibrillarin-like pre-rRNA processing protein